MFPALGLLIQIPASSSDASERLEVVVEALREEDRRFDRFLAQYELTTRTYDTDVDPEPAFTSPGVKPHYEDVFDVAYGRAGDVVVWETRSRARPASHVVSWTDGEVFRHFQPVFDQGDISNRPLEAGGWLPTRWFAEMDRLPWSEFLQSATSVDRRAGSSPVGGTIELSIQKVGRAGVAEWDAALVPEWNDRPSRVVARFDGARRSVYELLAVERTPQGFVVPAHYRTQVVHRRWDDPSHPVTLVAQTDARLVRLAWDPVALSKLDALRFPDGAQVTNEFVESAAAPAGNLERALARRLRELGPSERADVPAPPPFPWFESLEPAEPGSDDLAAELERERATHALCGPIALLGLKRLLGRDAGTPTPRLASLEGACHPAEHGAEVADVMEGARGIGLELVAFECADRRAPRVDGAFVAILDEPEGSKHYALARTLASGELVLYGFPRGTQRVLPGDPLDGWSGAGLFARGDAAFEAWFQARRGQEEGPDRHLLVVAAAGVVVLAGVAVFLRRRAAVASRLGVLLMFAALAGTACEQHAAEPPSARAGPLPAFSTPVFDFGDLRPRVAVGRRIPIVNPAAEAFVIDRVLTGCSLSVGPGAVGARVPASGRFELPVVWGINGFGEGAQPLTVVGHLESAPDRPIELTTELRGHAVGELALEPPRLVLRGEPGGHWPARTVRIHHLHGAEEPPFRVHEAKTSHAGLRVTSQDRSEHDAAGGEHVHSETFRVEFAGDAPTGDAAITFVLEGDAGQTLVLPVAFRR